MAKRLILMRHGEAIPASRQMSDPMRPLSEVGRLEVKARALEFQKLGLIFEAVAVSSAERTLSTWKVLEGELRSRVLPLVASSLYMASISALERLIEAEVGLSAKNSLLAIGHNPSWSEAIEVLANRDWHLGTSHVAVLDSAEDTWPEAFAGSWKLQELLPKNT